MENKFNREKITLTDVKLGKLINAISANEGLALNLSDEIKDARLKRNKIILEKLDKFKKIDDKGNNYFYLYLKEFKDLFWILFELYDSNTQSK